MLVFPLNATSFCLSDFLSDKEWFCAQQVRPARPYKQPFRDSSTHVLRVEPAMEDVRVIACIEEPWLMARILGHVQQRLESDNQPARAPPGHQEQTFNLM